MCKSGKNVAIDKRHISISNPFRAICIMDYDTKFLRNLLNYATMHIKMLKYQPPCPSNLPNDNGDDCRRRPYWTLARLPSTCSVRDGRSSWRQSSASSGDDRFTCRFPLTNALVHHTVTGLPKSGCSHKALTTLYAQTRHNHKKGFPGVKELQ